jgi:hypothetical protein
MREQREEAAYSSQVNATTLNFSFDVTTGFPSGMNDWNGIEVEKFQLFTIPNFIESTLTKENVVADFVDVSFATIRIDADTPEYSSLAVNPVGANNVAGTEYINAENSDGVQLILTLTEKDTWDTNNFTITDGTNTGTLSFGDSDIGEKTTGTKGSQNNFFNGWNGPILVSAISFVDKAGKNIASLPALPLTTNIVVDTTSPVIAIDDDTSAVAVTTDTIQASITDTNADLGAYAYGFSADNVCDVTDIYPNIFTTGTSFDLVDQSHNGQYICFRATDLAENTTYQVSTNPISIDITSPVFGSIGVVSDNTVDPNYAKSDSTLTFTLSLTTPDSFAGGGATTGRIEFTIGGQARTAELVETADYATVGAYTAEYALSGENGAITITSIVFQDRVGNDIDLTSFVSGQNPIPTVIVDTVLPTLDTATVSTSGNSGWAKNMETVTYTLNFDEDIRLQTLNSATVFNNATTLSQEFDINMFGTSDQLVAQIDDGDNGAITLNNMDVIIRDRAGNTSTITAATTNAKISAPTQITADTTIPTIGNVTIASNNPNDTTLAKTNDTIRVDFVTADNLSPTVSLQGSSQILNQVITSDVVGTTGNTWMERFTDGTEMSEIVVPFLIAVMDEAGNISTDNTVITSGSTVQFDRTDPLVSNVKISATSTDSSAYMGHVPTYYAKSGDTIDFSFQTCDYVDTITTPAPSGTLFGQAVTMTDDGLGSACTTPEGNSTRYRKWKTQITNMSGAEGLVTFSVAVYDEAGNGVLTVTGTTDGSQVIFDTTRPTLPTQTLDTLGAEKINFKHRSNAHFDWAGASDPTTSGTDVIAGIWKYKLRLTNPANGGEDHRGTAAAPEETTNTVLDGRTSNIPDPGQTSIPARADNNPYQLRLITVDKAGNHSHGNQTTLDWSHDPIYEQPYTIGIQGTVTNVDGEPLAGVVVQVVPRYGEVCDTNQKICTATTDSSGFYSRVIKKEQDYTVNYFVRGFYLYKADERIERDDLTVNPTLTLITNNRIEQQSGSQTVFITTDGRFVDEYDITRRTEIYVSSFSGNVTTVETQYQNQQAIKITSLSEIFSVTVNNPNSEIINLGNNEYIITNTGKVETNNGALNEYTVNPLKKSISIPTTIGNSGSYSGMKRISARAERRIWTRAEVTADNERIDAGVPGTVNHYTNRNGYKIFAGYTNGRLPIKHLYRPRNIPIATNIASALHKEEQIRNNPQMGQKLIMQTSRKKLKVADIVKKRHQFRASTVAGDASHYRAVTKRYARQKNKINKFERTRSTTATKSRMIQLAGTSPRYRLMRGVPTINLDRLNLLRHDK